MKTYFTILLFSISFFAFSQSNFQIADTTKKWNTVTYGIWAWGVAYCGDTYRNKIADEMIINDKVFYKVYETTDSSEQNWYSKGNIWEDTINKKVFYTHGNPNGDGLIYDFGIAVGDSVIIDNYYVGFYDVTLICDSIKSVIINDVSRKKYFFSGLEYTDGLLETWIEGIGSTYGLLYSGYGAAEYYGGGMTLLCCSKNDTLLYQNSGFNTCFIQEFNPQIVNDSFDTAYVNSYYEFQLELSGTENINSYKLIGNEIPNEFEFDTTTGLLTGFPHSTGSFPCVITVRNNDIGMLTDIIYSKIDVVLPAKNHDLLKVSKIRIHPNPFCSYLEITFVEKIVTPHSLEIYGCEGKLLDKRMIWENELKMDFSNFDNGIYFFIIRDSNQEILKSEKIIKYN